MNIQRHTPVAAGSLARIFAMPGRFQPVLAPEGAGGGPTPEQAAADLKRATDEVKRFAEQAQTEIKNLGTMNGETKALADKALTGLTAATAAHEAAFTAATTRMDAIEQKMARRPGPDGLQETKSAGELFVESDNFKNFVGMSSRRGTVEVKVERKNITSASSTLGSTADISSSLVVAQRIAPVPLAMRPFAIRDLVAPGETSSNAIEYAVMVSRIQSAAFVAEGALKPQSDLTFDLRNAPRVDPGAISSWRPGKSWTTRPRCGPSSTPRPATD